MFRRPALGVVILWALGIPAEGQQIYRWTDAQGQTHFGNAPPPDAAQVEAKDRARTEVERDCAAAADRQCRRDIKVLNTMFDDRVPTTAIRDCLAEYTATCIRRTEMLSAAEPPPRRILVTPRVSYDSAAGDTLICEMRCGGGCSGSIEIRDLATLTDRSCVGECRVQYVPQRSGSAFCRATTGHPGATIELDLVRRGEVVASTRSP